MRLWHWLFFGYKFSTTKSRTMAQLAANKRANDNLDFITAISHPLPGRITPVSKEQLTDLIAAVEPYDSDYDLMRKMMGERSKRLDSHLK